MKSAELKECILEFMNKEPRIRDEKICIYLSKSQIETLTERYGENCGYDKNKVEIINKGLMNFYG